MVQNVYTDCFIPEIGCRLYLDASGQTAAPAGKYSDGTNCYGVDSDGYVTVVNLCGELAFQFTSTDISDFIWAMDITGSNYGISLPLPVPGTSTAGDPPLSYDFYVNWGDGNTTGPITSYNTGSINHTYTSPGIYTASISGRMEGWRTNVAPGVDSPIRFVMKDVIQWGNTNLREISIGFSPNFDSVCKGQPSQYYWQDATSFMNNNRFWGDLSIRPNSKPIPQGVFEYASNVSTFTNAFALSVAQNYIPENLFGRAFRSTTFGSSFAGFGNATGSWNTPSGSNFITSGSYQGILSVASMFLNTNNLAYVYSSSFDGLLISKNTRQIGASPLGNGYINASSFMSNVSGVQATLGDAPELWIFPVGGDAPLGTQAFRNRNNLSNYASIPGGFK